jgi:choline kinase
MGGGTPKTLLPLDDKQPLMSYILEGLRTSGITDVLIVTGHRPDEIQAYVDEHGSGLEVAYVRNARFASWGNFHSVRVALDQSPGYDVLVVNSDVVVAPDVYKRVTQTAGDLVLAVEKRLVLDEEDMRVRLQGDRVLAIGKDLKRAYSHGEYAGVSLLRPDAARRYLDISTELEWANRIDPYYEDLYGEMMADLDVRAALLADGEYAEVDTPDDVAAAVAIIERHQHALAPQGSAEALA